MPIHGYPGGVITANPVAPTSTVATGVWTTEQQLQATAAGNWPRPGPAQPISRSLRFNSADSTYLNRTPASAGNRKTWTWSGWVKRSTLGTVQGIFDAYVGGNDFATAFFNSDNTIYFYTCTSGPFIDYDFTTTAVFRDASAWYHIVLVLDTSNATQADRFIVYVNGVRQAGTNPSGAFDLNVETYINSTASHRLGQRVDGSYYFNGYMTEVYFIGGSALTPSSFGQTNTATGVWEPISYTGSYSGTNSFYLNFSDNSGTTSTTLGKDSSGNGNNWTPNNFSVTAGAGNDSMVDSPTSYGTDTGVGGEVRGNYCTLNPLDVSANTLSNGNLDITYATNSDTNRGGTIAVSTGKWYFEATVQAVGGTYAIIGVTSGVATATSLGSAAYQYSYISSTGNKFNNGSSTAYGNTYTTGDVIGVALDMDNGKVWFSKNGTFQASGDPAAGTNQAFSGLSGSFSPAINARNNSIVNLNCGQRAFAYTAPSGFKALCTQNLPTPTIGATSTTQANDYFDVKTWSGNSSTQSIALEFAPGLIWNKSRNAASGHSWWDVLRGTGAQISSNQTDAESTGYNAITSFSNNAISLGADNTGLYNGRTNETGRTYVGWVWNAGGSNATNTSGTITSTVRANTTSGFSIVTYTGNGSTGTVGHGLGVAPSMIILKGRTNADQWFIWHNTFTSSQYIYFNTTAIVSGANPWNSTLPTSTLFSLGTDAGVNGNTTTYVAYCFANVEGYSRAFSYTGNGSTDGPFVYLGFRPEFVMIKRTDSANEWLMHDSARSPYNVVNARLSAQSSAAESTSPDALDFTSNGFKLRTTDTGWNASGGTYIYMAFAESPFKYSLAR